MSVAGARSIEGSWHLVPEHIRDRLDAHIGRGELVGDFLTALLSNDLRQAVLRADDINRFCLRDIVVFLSMDAPSPCWGSLEAVERWRSRGGLAGIAEGRWRLREQFGTESDRGESPTSSSPSTS